MPVNVRCDLDPAPSFAMPSSASRCGSRTTWPRSSALPKTESKAPSPSSRTQGQVDRQVAGSGLEFQQTGGGVAGGARAMRTASSIPPPGQSSTATVRPRPRGSQAAVVRGRVPRRDWDGLLAGGGSSAPIGRRRGRSGRVRGLEQAQVREDLAHHGRVLHGCDELQPAATAWAGEHIEIEHAAH